MLLQFKRSFKRNDKPICQAICLFIAHLVNQQVADDILAFEIAIFLLDKPSGMSADTSTPLGRPYVRLFMTSWGLSITYSARQPGRNNSQDSGLRGASR